MGNHLLHCSTTCIQASISHDYQSTELPVRLQPPRSRSPVRLLVIRFVTLLSGNFALIPGASLVQQYITSVECQSKFIITPQRPQTNITTSHPSVHQSYSSQHRENHEFMNTGPQEITSTINSQTDRATSEVPEVPHRSKSNAAETPQPIAERRSQSAPSVSQEESSSRQGRALTARHSPRNSSSQSPRRELNPYTQPISPQRAYSQPTSSSHSTSTTMSSASTPSNTSTAGASSGSNPSYQLPYAPFPYPMPANSGQQSDKGKGK